MFSNKQWVDPPFCWDEVNGDPSLSTEEVQGTIPPPAGSPASAVKGKKRKCRAKRKRAAASGRRCGRKGR
jgi:hypothetical protein